MTIFGNILFWLVTILVLAFSIYIALDITKYTRNEFTRWLVTGLITAIAFIVIEICVLCTFAICNIIAYDKGELRDPLYNSMVSKELHAIGCKGDFDMVISKDENGEFVRKTIN